MHLTAPYTPQQNGVVERRNQTIVGMARSLLKARKVPARFWGEAVTTAVHLLNRATTNSVAGMTPYQAWCGRRPSVQHLRTFGCVAHVKVTRPNVKNLDDRSVPMVFLGYEPGSASYRVYHPPSGRVHVSRDVVFDENASWDWGSVAEGQDGGMDSFIVELAPAPTIGVQARKTDAPTVLDTMPTMSAEPSTSQARYETPPPFTPVQRAPIATPTGIEFVSPPAGASEAPAGEEAPRRYRTLENVWETTKEVEAIYSDGELCMFAGEEPASFTEAEKEQG